MGIQTNRRAFLAGSAGLVIGVMLPPHARAKQASGAAAFFNQAPKHGDAFAPNAFVRIAPDNTVTVLIKHIEFGQGPYTGLTTLVAEELDADWGQMRAAAAPANAELYANTAFGIQGTGGSTAMPNSYMQMRKAGAAARAMLVAAAAEKFDVPAAELTVAKGLVSHGKSGQSATFGDLAEAAAKQEAPADPPVKDRKDFVFIGKDVPKVDTVAKSNGTAQFTMDIHRDDMLTVVVAHPPKFGGKLKSFDASKALEVPGVEKVAEVPTGVAVYATNTFAAMKGRDALTVSWDFAAAETRSSDQMLTEWTEAAQGEGMQVAQHGDPAKALEVAETTHESTIQFPFLAHAPMEPLDAVVELKDGAAEVWMGSQLQTVDHGTIAGNLGIDPSKVTLHTMLAGGSFGRRATGDSHLAAEAAQVAKARGDGATKLIWSREDDIQGGYYRPLTVHRMKGGLDKDGNITAWDHTIACQSIMEGTPFEMMMQDGLDPTAFEGANELPYTVPNHRLGWAKMTSAVPVLWWRSVGHTHTAFAVETFIDELLAKAGKDAVDGRLALMKDDFAREKAVLRRVADMADWSGPGTGDTRRGVSVWKSFDSYVAEIAEVGIVDDEPRIKKVWCAVDCGVAVNPGIIKAQMEGGIGYAASAMLFDEIALNEGGTVRQANFDTYRMLRMPEMPQIEVSIIDSEADPTGVGEPGTPPLGPAVANAWRALTGKQVSRLPMVPTA